MLGLALATGCGLLRKPQSCCGWLLTTLLLAALGRWAAAERWGALGRMGWDEGMGQYL